jgi:hypothetical protein
METAVNENTAQVGSDEHAALQDCSVGNEAVASAARLHTNILVSTSFAFSQHSSPLLNDAASVALEPVHQTGQALSEIAPAARM